MSMLRVYVRRRKERDETMRAEAADVDAGSRARATLRRIDIVPNFAEMQRGSPVESSLSPPSSLLVGQ
jgi:hypothetical protein